MAKKSESLIKTYTKLAQIPALLGAKHVAKGSVIHSIWSQRNLEKGKTSKFVKTHFSNGELGTFMELGPVDISSESLTSLAPSEKLKAVVRDVDTKDGSNQFLEVWNNNNLIRSIDLNSLDIHGKIYTDAEFGCLLWSPDETRVLYVAEKKVKKADPLNKRPKKSDEKKNDDSIVFTAEQFRQDWGEQLVGKISSILVCYDLNKDDFIFLEGLPENVSPAQPVWSPGGDYIVGIAYKTTPRKLGLIYCSNRLSSIFQIDFEGNYKEIKGNDKSVKSPKFTPNGKSLVWLERAAGGPHHGCMLLMQTDVPITETAPVVKVDIVEKVKQIANGKSFYGLYNTSFPRRCWTNDGRLLLSTNQRNEISSYVVNLDSNVITELEFNDGSQIVLDVFDDNLLANRRNFFQQDSLVSGKLPAPGMEADVTWKQVTQLVKLDNAQDLMYQYLDLEQDTEEDIKKFTAIYVGPKSGDKEKVPLIVWPHGGPHSAFGNNLSLETSLFLTFGVGILMVNYRGSVGAGEASVNYLPGKAGTSDVNDCVYATKKSLEMFSFLQPSKIGLVGGSHGGFLVTHLSGQYPDLYKVVVARNPVIDIASMSTVSDIPDWCYVEGGAPYSQEGPINEEILLAMRKASPIIHAHNVKAPTLLQIGTKDLRVPPSQGVEYYHRLKANNVIVEMNIYDDNHPLGTVPNEMSDVISTAMWLDEHLVLGLK